MTHATGREIEVDVEPSTPFNVDGEIVEGDADVRFAVDDDAFELIVGA